MFSMDQPNQVSSRRRGSKQQIQDLLNEFEKSNLTAKDFCKEHHISRPNFHKWKSRYRSKSTSRQKASGFTTLDLVDVTPVSAGLFAEVKGIKIYQPVSASFLKELL